MIYGTDPTGVMYLMPKVWAPQEIKLALITNIDSIAKIFFNEEKAEARRELEKAERALKMIDNINYTIRNYVENRQRMLSTINDKIASISDRDIGRPEYLSNKTGDDLKKAKAEQKKYAEELQMLNHISGNPASSDADYTNAAKIIMKYAGWFPSYTYDNFKASVSDVRKIERTILEPRKLTITSDLSGIKAEVDAELEKAKQAYSVYESDKSPRYKAIYDELVEKKAKMQVDGKTALERVKDFGELNYLLQYLREMHDPDNCPFPKKTDKPGYCVVTTSPQNEDDRARKIRILKAKIRIELELLKLLEI